MPEGCSGAMRLTKGQGEPQHVCSLPQVVEAYLGVDSDAPHSLAAVTAQQAVSTNAQ